MPPAEIRSFHHRDYTVDALVRAKGGRRVAVCLPARDEETTVGPIVARIRQRLVERAPLVDEIVVVDDGSRERTGALAAEAGARVVAGSGAGGKGGALHDAVRASSAELLAFCDADVRDFDPRFVVGLLGPLLVHDDVRFVKAFYERGLDGAPRGGGRVTELMARPLLTVLFPELAAVVQPLAGEFAAARDDLATMAFVEGYGVDLGLLVDAAARFGTGALAQVDLGRRVHRNRPLDELGPMATVILLTALRRAGVEVPDEVVLRAPDAGETLVRYRALSPLSGATDTTSST